MTCWYWPARVMRTIRKSTAYVSRSPIWSKRPTLWRHGRWRMLKALRLSEVAAPLAARVIGADVAFSAVSSDSRAVPPGQLFVALAGPRFDGHDYLAEVAGKGAVAALVEREVAGAALPPLPGADTPFAP